MNRELDKSQIVKQWGPWTLTSDGCLHNADISKLAKEDWYVELYDIRHSKDLYNELTFFMYHLLLVSDKKDSYLTLKEILAAVFNGPIEDGKSSKFYVDKFIRENSHAKRIKLQPSLRFKILHRDQYRCQTCGASAAGGADLHIDHILPVSKGGTNDESNLRALCSECNIGRGNRYDA